MKYFTSDHHFGHNNIIKLCNRPYVGIHDMTEDLIARHNARVGKEDEVYFLGDMFWQSFGLQNAYRVLERMAGKKYFIRGNHDEIIDQGIWPRSDFDWIKDMHIIPSSGGHPSITLCHYPMRSWEKSHHGSWSLYGHHHGDLPEDNRWLSFDVGVDANNFSPVSLDEVIAKMKTKREP